MVGNTQAMGKKMMKAMLLKMERVSFRGHVGGGGCGPRPKLVTGEDM